MHKNATILRLPAGLRRLRYGHFRYHKVLSSAILDPRTPPLCVCMAAQSTSDYISSYSSWWLNPPESGKYARQFGSFPQGSG